MVMHATDAVIECFLSTIRTIKGYLHSTMREDSLTHLMVVAYRAAYRNCGLGRGGGRCKHVLWYIHIVKSGGGQELT